MGSPRALMPSGVAKGRNSGGPHPNLGVGNPALTGPRWPRVPHLESCLLPVEGLMTVEAAPVVSWLPHAC